MIEAEWLTCTDLPLLIKELRQCGQDRKLRLLACACVRRLWDTLPELAREAVDVAERFADGSAVDKELAAAHHAMRRMWIDVGLAWAGVVAAGEAVVEAEASSAALYATIHSLDARFSSGMPNRKAARAGERHAQLLLLRCIFGNPYRAVALDSAWRTPTILALSQVIYDDNRFTDLPILADALEEAGCDNTDILAHCRGPGPHARGCWVVDLVLGKT